MFSSWKTSPFLCVGIFLWITLHVQCRPSSSTDHDPGTTDITKCGPNDTVPPNRVNTSVQLNLVRQEMTRVNITVLIIPLDSVGRLKWVSGFSGSNGEAVITHDQGMGMNQIVKNHHCHESHVAALLWTDGRYFIQADDQLDCNWRMMRMVAYDSDLMTDQLCSRVLMRICQTGCPGLELVTLLELILHWWELEHGWTGDNHWRREEWS